MKMMNDIDYMKLAISLARESGECAEVPVGAVIVKDGEIIATGRNTKETNRDPAGHAEMNAIRAACEKLGNWRLSGCTLYVTMEPCPMCAGAVLSARVSRVVYGVKDANAGAYGSVFDMRSYPLLHKPEVESSVCAQECGEVLSNFFRAKRQDK